MLARISARTYLCPTHIQLSSNYENTPRTPVQWGSGALTDQIVPGDYDGDMKTDIAVWRESDGNWLIIISRDHFARLINWGHSGDKPVPSDYDGDGRARSRLRSLATLKAGGLTTLLRMPTYDSRADAKRVRVHVEKRRRR
ncbi:MAG TPA: VCBS repeat-containing protein [Pyrinomonadaceae bacterium]